MARPFRIGATGGSTCSSKSNQSPQLGDGTCRFQCATGRARPTTPEGAPGLRVRPNPPVLPKLLRSNGEAVDPQTIVTVRGQSRRDLANQLSLICVILIRMLTKSRIRPLLLTATATMALGAIALPASADGSASESKLPTSHDLVGGRFISTVALDDGVLTVVPAPATAKPALTRQKAATEIWASPALMSRREGPLALGLVTISMHSPGVPRVSRLLAWVGFAKTSSVYHCPDERLPTTTVGRIHTLASNGYAAVIIGAATGAPAVSYVARSEACGTITEASLARATEAISVPWEQVSRSAAAIEIQALVPRCGTLGGISSGGSSRAFTISVGAVVPDVVANCSPPHYVTQTVDFGPPSGAPGAPPPVVTTSTSIIHGRLGPIPLANSA
jgi:hypothetical protein